MPPVDLSPALSSPWTAASRHTVEFDKKFNERDCGGTFLKKGSPAHLPKSFLEKRFLQDRSLRAPTWNLSVNLWKTKRLSSVYQKVFVHLFLKGGEVKGEEPLSPSAEGETPPNGVSFLITFFFAPLVSKKKVAKELAHSEDRRRQKESEDRVAL